MPSSIAHMLISRLSRAELKKSDNGGLVNFIKDVLEPNAVYMELGSIGPDLPYYENMAESGVKLFLDRPDKPLGVEPWSYQLHSKDPNLFPLRMFEVLWKETDVNKTEWDSNDHSKFAFACGHLTHMAADQIIHPLVNVIAGPYYKGGDARKRHRACEVYQDVWIYNKSKSDKPDMRLKEFYDAEFNLWCDLVQGLDLSTCFGMNNTPEWFRYMVQKTFIEAHAVTPSEDSIEAWVDGTLFFLRLLNNFGPFTNAQEDIDTYGERSAQYKEYIKLEQSARFTDQVDKDTHARVVGRKTYVDFFHDAVKLASIYVKVAYKIYESNQLDDGVRGEFRKVVSNADLGTPLEGGILQKATDALGRWDPGLG